MTFLVMFFTPFGFSAERAEMMGEGDRLEPVDLVIEGERGGRGGLRLPVVGGVR